MNDEDNQKAQTLFDKGVKWFNLIILKISLFSMKVSFFRRKPDYDAALLNFKKAKKLLGLNKEKILLINTKIAVIYREQTRFNAAAKLSEECLKLSIDLNLGLDKINEYYNVHIIFFE